MAGDERVSTDLEEACGRKTIRKQRRRLLDLGPCELLQVALRQEYCLHNLAVVPRHQMGGICRKRK